jgi:hypothetical protein
MWIGLRPDTRAKLIGPPFNARELASVKVMLEHVDEGLDITADAPQFADGLDLGRPVA